ncbi:hypothetical protein HDF13_001015 [Edaphobacter lichenicola]|uniref:Uncharacterized protein n=1 Tax=Tunturiibacter gelidiferens TaxID=3069689 RepID=A0ACC5NVT0_9BACT|nr:hypothetical protein [Edaphobacter lichenicola]
MAPAGAIFIVESIVESIHEPSSTDVCRRMRIFLMFDIALLQKNRQVSLYRRLQCGRYFYFVFGILFTNKLRDPTSGIRRMSDYRAR